MLGNVGLVKLICPFLTVGAHPPACLAALHPCWQCPAALVPKVLMNSSLMAERFRWLTWTTECPAQISSKLYMTPSLDMDR